MTLIDAVYINNGGGKILLEYLITELENHDIDVTYLLDERYSGILPKNNKILRLKPSLYERHIFYLRNKNTFKKILCFGNIPPTVKMNSTVFTYFHQFLFLINPNINNPKFWVLIHLKKIIIKYFKKYTNFWITQNQYVSDKLSNFLNCNVNNILIIPFFRSLKITNSSIKRKKQFLYVSNGEPHKNHLNLIIAFKLFYDKYQTSELHLTIPENYKSILSNLSVKYPIINHECLNDNELVNLYCESEFFIFPSKFESFGLGIVEAVECGCKVIGSDLPFLHQICKPTFVFNQDSVNSIFNALEYSYFSETNQSQLNVTNDIKQLINILKTE